MTQKPRNADYTKEYNRKAVLSMLRRSSMSRAELARATGLSRAATSLIAEELLKDGIVMELPPQSGADAVQRRLPCVQTAITRWQSTWQERAAASVFATCPVICCNFVPSPTRTDCWT